VANLIRQIGNDSTLHSQMILSPTRGGASSSPFATLSLIISSDWGISRLRRPTGCLPKPELPDVVIEARARARNGEYIYLFIYFDIYLFIALAACPKPEFPAVVVEARARAQNGEYVHACIYTHM